ncbi:hypothetical protein ANTQUA_LOCUS2593 [Anthophora quadrimaculata]
MHSSFVILCLAVYPMRAYGREPGHFCRYWCRTIDHRYYCCPSGKAESWPEYIWHSFLYPWLWRTGESILADTFESEIIVHEKETTKHCPPSRTYCPRSYDWYSPPTSCSGDEDCNGREKCCYDVCLEHKTCKHAE